MNVTLSSRGGGGVAVGGDWWCRVFLRENLLAHNAALGVTCCGALEVFFSSFWTAISYSP